MADNIVFIPPDWDEEVARAELERERERQRQLLNNFNSGWGISQVTQSQTGNEVFFTTANVWNTEIPIFINNDRISPPITPPVEEERSYMNLRDLKANNYAIFSRMAEENREEHKGIIRYIERLAREAEADISGWNILGVFGTGRGNHLRMSRAEINKLFLARLKQEEDFKCGKIEHPDMLELEKKLTKNLSQTLQHRVEEYERQYKQNIRSIQEYSQHVENFTQHAANARNAMRQLKSEKLDMTAQLRTIQEGDFWNFDHFDGTSLWFATKQNVILRHINKKAHVDIQVNLGKFRAEINTNRNQIRVHTHKDNIVLGDQTIHPHVQHTGICWGQAGNTAYGLLADMRYDKLLQLLANLLMDYNDGNPYAAINDFKMEPIYREADKIWKEPLDAKLSPEDKITKFLKEKGCEGDDLDYYFNVRDPDAMDHDDEEYIDDSEFFDDNGDPR